ncbi:MAG: DNA-binding transcriptional regulator [Opitutales bacterium]|nr:DNA-binding transcriptional regulator [Opitutales bacterium]
MKRKDNKSPKRVAICLEMEWGHKRHLETYAGIHEYADKAGWDCVITPSATRVPKPKSGVAPFHGILGRISEPLAQVALKHKIPTVNVWLNSPAKNVSSVLPDLETSGRMAAQHLVGRGFKRFGYMGFLREKDSRLAIQGFREILKPLGFRFTTYRFQRTGLGGEALGWERFLEGLEKWVESLEAPTGILVSNDLYCRYLIETCRAKGLKVPQDVAIVGTSNEPAICASPYPTLTSIDLDFELIGFRAAAKLDEMMNKKDSPKTMEYSPPKGLIPRQSTDSHAAEDPVVAKALRFIAENGHERIQVNDVSAAVATTRRTLERKFRDSLGRTIAEEIARLRIVRAKRLMLETEESFKAMAIDLGFRNADHFCKVFSRVEGMTPSQYRKQRSKKISTD